MPALGVAQLVGTLVGGVLGAATDCMDAATTPARATFGVPLCPRCAARWARARRHRALAVLPTYVALVGMAVALLLLAPLGVFAVWGKYAFASIFGVLIHLARDLSPKLVEARVVTPATCGAVAMDAASIALTRVHPAARAALAPSLPDELHPRQPVVSQLPAAPRRSPCRLERS